MSDENALRMIAAKLMLNQRGGDEIIMNSFSINLNRFDAGYLYVSRKWHKGYYEDPKMETNSSKLLTYQVLI